MATQTWIKKYLKDRGYAEDQVGFDNDRKTVTLEGKDFMSNPTIENGRSMADRGSLNDRLSQFRQEKQADQAYNTGNQSMGQINDNLGTMNTMANQAPPEMKAPEPYKGFDPQTNEAFQAAARNIRRDLQTDTNNAMVNLGSRGIGNSQSAISASSQLLGRANERIHDQVLPQYAQQDYNRYRDGIDDSRYVDETNYGRGQDQFRNLDVATRGLQGQNEVAYGRQQDSIQQRIDRELRERDQRFQDEDRQSSQQQAEVDKLWNAAEQIGTLPNELADMFGLPRGTSTLEAERVGISRMNAQTSQMNAGTSRMNAGTSAANAGTRRSELDYRKEQGNLDELYRQWDRTGSAPEGIPGIPAGTPLPQDPEGAEDNSRDPNAYLSDPELIDSFSDDVQFIKSDPEGAKEAFEGNIGQFIRTYGNRGVRDMMKYFPKEEQNELLSIIEQALRE